MWALPCAKGVQQKTKGWVSDVHPTEISLQVSVGMRNIHSGDGTTRKTHTPKVRKAQLRLSEQGRKVDICPEYQSSTGLLFAHSECNIRFSQWFYMQKPFRTLGDIFVPNFLHRVIEGDIILKTQPSNTGRVAFCVYTNQICWLYVDQWY